MNKTLKFDSHVIPFIQQGIKKITWRLFDDKNLQTGDIVDFLDTNTKERFATAKLVKVEEKLFKHLTDKDWEGHEKYEHIEDMYKYYSERYKKPVTPNIALKVIWYELI